MFNKNQILISTVAKTIFTAFIFFVTLPYRQSVFAMEIYHFKQISDDGNTVIVYSLRCSSADKESCTLRAVGLANEKAKYSCYLFYKNIFENEKLQEDAKGSHFVKIERNKCDDVVIYEFHPRFMKTFYKADRKNATSIKDDYCDVFKVKRNKGDLIVSDHTVPFIGFGSCKMLSLKIDDD